MSKVDHQIETDALFATVEFKAANGKVTSRWTVTGIGKDNFPCLALNLTFPLVASGEMESISEVNQLFQSHIEPLALKSMANGGLNRGSEKAQDPLNPVFALHAKHFQDCIVERNKVNDTFVTAGLYRLAKLLEVKKPIDFLTSYLRLPESTINRRLTKARDSGLIAKRSEEQSG